MARYKDYNYEQGKMIPISFREQILPGTFEYTLSHLIDHELDLSIFDQRYNNDDSGRPAYDPALLLKIVLYAYARGIVSSRRIERCCRENVIFMALSADTQPHFTTVAGFISQMEGEIVALFRNVLLICDAQGLIGCDMFAIDGCKLLSQCEQGMERHPGGTGCQTHQVGTHYPRSREEKRQWQGRADRFTNKDFRYDPDKHTCICPAGKSLYSNGSNITINGYTAVKFTAPKSACRPCHLRARCLKFPDRTEVRQVCFFSGDTRKPETFTQAMKRKIDSLVGKAIYNRRIATVEPVFGHLRNIGLYRFTLRGKKKVDAQWKLYCIVHNLLKIHRYGEVFG